MPEFRKQFAGLVGAMALLIGGTAAAQALSGDEPGKGAPAASGARPEALIVDRVAAVVDDHIILESELALRLQPMAADVAGISDPVERDRRLKALAGQILEDLVNEELMLHAAEEAKLDVTSKEIDAALDDKKRQNNVNDEQLAAALKELGYTLSSYREDVRRQLLRFRAINVLVKPRVNVSDEDVRAAYDERSRRSGAVTRVHLHHIRIALPERPTQQQVAEAKAKAATVIERVRGGETFTDLTEEYSDDIATSASGGDLGWIERGSIATEWEAIVFSMAKDEVRGPISGPSGLHVFYVSETEQEAQKPFDEVKEAIRADLYRRDLDKQTRQWLDELRKKAHVEVKL